MPRHSAPEPEFSNQDPSAVGEHAQPEGAGFETDLMQLSARFTSLGSSPELSADLALQIVLNEIVEQACLATGASGAAIVLKRDGQMICRATSGTTAPELGARLDNESGLSGLCLRTRRMQRCDDVLADERADLEASARLGVRSVIVIPLLRDAELAGVLEAFSSRPSAFGERDERTLEVLAARAVRNLVQAEPVLGGVEEESEPALEAGEPATVSEESGPVDFESAGRSSSLFLQRRYDFFTWALAAAILGCAISLALLTARHLGAFKAARRHSASSTSAASASTSASGAASAGGSAVGSSGVRAASDSGAGGGSERADNSASKIDPAKIDPAKIDPAKIGASQVGASTIGPTKNGAGKAGASGAVPVGGLLVYKDGKEVFRMDPSRDTGVQNEAQESGQNVGVHQATSIEPDATTAGATRTGATTTDGVMELAAGDADLLRRVEPEYPEAARQQKIQGAVVLEVRAGRDGSVQHISLISGPPLLVDPAIAAVTHWQFKPHVVKGQAVAIQTRVTLNFRLAQ